MRQRLAPLSWQLAVTRALDEGLSSRILLAEDVVGRSQAIRRAWPRGAGGRPMGRVLVLVPAGLRNQWADELKMRLGSPPRGRRTQAAFRRQRCDIRPARIVGRAPGSWSRQRQAARGAVAGRARVSSGTWSSTTTTWAPDPIATWPPMRWRRMRPSVRHHGDAARRQRQPVRVPVRGERARNGHCPAIVRRVREQFSARPLEPGSFASAVAGRACHARAAARLCAAGRRSGRAWLVKRAASSPAAFLRSVEHAGAGCYGLARLRQSAPSGCRSTTRACWTSAIP